MITTEIVLKWFIKNTVVLCTFHCGDFSGVRKSDCWIADPGQRVGGTARSDLRKTHTALLMRMEPLHSSYHRSHDLCHELYIILYHIQYKMK